MYTYLTARTTNIDITIDGELQTFPVGEPIKGTIELNTKDKEITVTQLIISIIGIRQKGRDLKLDRFNVKHEVDIGSNSTLKFPYRIIIDSKKYRTSMTVELQLKIKTNLGELETRATLLNISSEESL